MKNRTAYGALAAGALLALASIGGPAEAREMRDRIAQANDIDRHQLTTVAVLPAVSINGDEQAEVRAEAGWVALYGHSQTHWMRADEVGEMIAAAGPGLARAVREQIWRRGEVDPQTAERLCRVLGVDAVISLRVDRWELAERRGMVAMTVTLNGADGARLWTASGLAGHGRRELPDTDALEHPDHRTCAAYSTLLTRWAAQLPPSMHQEVLASDVMAFVFER